MSTELPSSSALAHVQNVPLPSSPPLRKPTAERRREQRRLRSIYGEGATGLSPDVDRRKTRARLRSPANLRGAGARSTAYRASPLRQSIQEFGSSQEFLSLSVLEHPETGGDDGRRGAQKPASATHNAEAIRSSAAPVTPMTSALEIPIKALAPDTTPSAQDASDEIVARHAAYGGNFTSSAWLKAQRSAKTREPLCPFDPGPGGLCRNCHQKQSHDWHRLRTPPQTQPTTTGSTSASVSVVGPGGEANAMPELAAATVLAPRGKEPANEALILHEEYRKAKDARRARIEKLPANDYAYSIHLESFEAGRRTTAGDHITAEQTQASSGRQKSQPGRPLRNSRNDVVAQDAGAEADLAALLQRRWDEEWTLLERSVGSKKEGARQRDRATERAQQQAAIQQTWNAAQDAAKEVRLNAAAEQLRERKLAEEEHQAEQALAAAKLKREIEVEQARQAREAEQAEREAAWRAMTGGFTALLDEYGIGGGGGVIRAGKVVKLREGMQERHDQENRTAARVRT